MFIIFVNVKKKMSIKNIKLMKKIILIIVLGIFGTSTYAQEIIPTQNQKTTDSIQKIELARLEKEKADKEALKAKEKAEKEAEKAEKERKKAEDKIKDEQKAVEKERAAAEKARKEAEKARKKAEKEREKLTDARDKVADLRKDIVKNKEKIKKEKEKFDKDKRKGKLSPDDEIKRQKKIEKLIDESTELQNKLEKAQIKLDKIR